MTINISFNDSLKSGYLYGYASIALATCVIVLMMGNNMIALLLLILIIPYVIGAFIATYTWDKGSSDKLYITFPFGKHNNIVFTNIEAQIMLSFLMICAGSIALAYYIGRDPYVSMITSIYMFFVFVHQLLLCSAIDRSSAMFMLPLFISSTSVVCVLSYVEYKQTYDNTSILDKLDFNGFPLAEHKNEISSHHESMKQFTGSRSTHVGDNYL
jgi:hypothetical protein